MTYDRAMPAGWVHLAAVRGADHLCLYVNGKLVAKSAKFESADYNISNDQPLKIGFGPHDFFNGILKDVRLYRRELTEPEVAALQR